MKKKPAPRTAPKAKDASRAPRFPLSPARARLFLAITLVTPLVLLAALELVLRLFWAGGAMPLFVPSRENPAEYITASSHVARRYFPAEQFPPAPPHDLFAAVKPAHAFRVIVMGESSAAGFPYPHNGTFSRVLRDALRDVLPHDSVEVVNVGIAATNSYTMLDFASEVIAARPDAVLIYGGHNEYYGALGVGSAVRIGGSPALVRLYVGALHLRTVVLLRSLLGAAQRALSHKPADDVAVASFMETVVRDQKIEHGSPIFAAGERQFDGNLRLLLGRFHHAGIPVFIGSLASNLRDQAPLASDANAGPNGANAAFAAATSALARGDTAVAREGFVKARDLDVVRFRAPSSFNAIIKTAAAAESAVYVPVAETFDSVAPGHIPGRELFLEHVHPTRHGYAVLASAFFLSLQRARFLGHEAQDSAFAGWPAYEERMSLSPFDERIAYHTTKSITSRWPFVPVAQQTDYRGTYRPVSSMDSLALLVARGGMPWEAAKFSLAEKFMAAAEPDSAVREARGLVRDAPTEALPKELAARALLLGGRDGEAEPFLVAAHRLRPTPLNTLALATIAEKKKDYRAAIGLYLEHLQLQPGSPNALFHLSLAYALSGDMANAKQYAAQALRVQPDFPGLAEWAAKLGIAAGR